MVLSGNWFKNLLTRMTNCGSIIVHIHRFISYFKKSFFTIKRGFPSFIVVMDTSLHNVLIMQLFLDIGNWMQTVTRFFNKENYNEITYVSLISYHFMCWQYVIGPFTSRKVISYTYINNSWPSLHNLLSNYFIRYS